MEKDVVQDERPPRDREMTIAIMGGGMQNCIYWRFLRLENHSAQTQSQYFPNMHFLPPSSVFLRCAKGPCQTHMHGAGGVLATLACGASCIHNESA